MEVINKYIINIIEKAFNKKILSDIYNIIDCNDDLILKKTISLMKGNTISSWDEDGIVCDYIDTIKNNFEHNDTLSYMRGTELNHYINDASRLLPYDQQTQTFIAYQKEILDKAYCTILNEKIARWFSGLLLPDIMANDRYLKERIEIIDLEFLVNQEYNLDTDKNNGLTKELEESYEYQKGKMQIIEMLKHHLHLSKDSLILTFDLNKKKAAEATL